jgi:PAS domain-containing protein
VDAEWIKSPTARRIFMHWADSRAAWLWSHDGSTLLWHNAAARIFNAKIKKSGLKLAPEAVPIKGQVTRLIRLGQPGRASLSRVQFLSGDKPVAATCTCTPLVLADGAAALLLVCLDQIPTEIREAAGELGPDAMVEALLPPGTEYVLVERNEVVAGSSRIVETQRARIEIDGLPDESAGVTRLAASPSGSTLLVFAADSVPGPSIAEVRNEEGVAADADPRRAEEEQDLADTPEPMLPLGLEPLPDQRAPLPAHDEWVEPIPTPTGDRQLSSLFDRLAEDAGLYTTLTAADEIFEGPPPDAASETLVPVDLPGPADVEPAPIAGAIVEGTEPRGADEPAPSTQEFIAAALGEPTLDTTGSEQTPAPLDVEVAPQAADTAAEWRSRQSDVIAAIIDFADELEPKTPTPDASDAEVLPPEPAEPVQVSPVRSHWMITGRGFRAKTADADDEARLAELDLSVDKSAETILPAPDVTPPAGVPAPPPNLVAVATVDEAPDAETAERVSRYNFEELGRILNDRVSGDAKLPEPAKTSPPPRPPSPEGVINLNAETLVLNRLPLAILVFRDQQVLFANRALTDLLGHESVESLRAAGIGSVFPAEGTNNSGPVNQLMRRDGTLLPVTARLQSVSWQGRAALMLSASPAEPMRGHEGAVRAFAEIAAEAREEGFIIADRAGIVTQVSGQAAVLLGRPVSEISGKPLVIFVAKLDMEPLRTFLEKPARFAETARPSLLATSEDGETEIVLFAEGQAGVVTGYFGFLRLRARIVPPPMMKDEDVEPGMLGRLSRGIRRPLNTIIGFADLLRSAGPGETDKDRTVEYARDIRTAGLEIAVLVDELEDFTRLRDGRYAPRPADVDLQALLENCMVRVKSQAGASRVLVRSAISERLPRIRADRASLGQALLNLLASAIDQTPVGGSVILSAQAEENGSINIHVRDGAASGTDLGERFVVFRDGVDKNGEQLTPVRSSVGLALTRSLLAVNACSLSVDPTAGVGTLFSMQIPADLVVVAAE